jgi:hypothetical protein
MSQSISGNFDVAPEDLLVEFLNPAGNNLNYSDLGAEFCKDFGIEKPAQLEKPFKISIAKKPSKSGNAYYEYSQQSVPFPDGLSTLLRINGFLIPMGTPAASKTSGNLQRSGKLEMVLKDDVYRITSYITKSKNPFFIKITVIKKPNTSANLHKGRKTPRGGSLVL